MKNFITKLTTNVLFGTMLFTNSVFPNSTSINSNALVLESDSTETITETVTPSTESQFQFQTPLIIKAINPGYTENKVRDVGELVELQLTTDITSFSLAGYALRYVNSSGKSTTLIEFSEGSSMVGEFLLLRLARTDNAKSAEATYTTTIAMSEGTLQLWRSDQIVDEVCWSKAETCLTPFDSDNPTTLVRDAMDGKFKHLSAYDTHYDAKQPSLVLPPEKPTMNSSDSNQTTTTTQPNTSSNTNQSPTQAPTPDVDDDESAPIPSKCSDIEFTELLSYYATDKSEQFIELYNATDEPVDITGCSIRYKKKTYPLVGKIAPEGYLTFYPSLAEPSFSLTKDPSTSNDVELLDSNGEVVDRITYEHGQKKSTSLAKFIDATNTEMWERTYAPTPGASNVYQEFRTCPEGKVINEATGNCIKVTSTSIVKQSTTSQKTTELAPCPEGKYRNPLTNRCKSLESATTSELKPCAEGYERNPETNRCRKIQTANDGETYALVPATYSDHKTFVALGAVLLLVGIGVIYIILQFRHEIARMGRKARQRLHHVRKNLIAWRARFHRHK